jgi:hypothetical protein
VALVLVVVGDVIPETEHCAKREPTASDMDAANDT